MGNFVVHDLFAVSLVPLPYTFFFIMAEYRNKYTGLVFGVQYSMLTLLDI